MTESVAKIVKCQHEIARRRAAGYAEVYAVIVQEMKCNYPI